MRADTLEDVRYLPGHYHELTESRKEQWACDLDQPYRLIFEPHKDTCTFLAEYATWI